ncbi:GNAT family N-acetyltransferase [Tritonibacter mobilis]|uniref:GNAT family N-acetyltransferase n=1 Tax=Tritonibacter mobilis TaxID=379347 RepID=UPI003A5C7460
MELKDLKSGRLHATEPAQMTAADREALFAPEVVAFLPPGFQNLRTDAARRHLIDALQQEAEVVALSAQDQEIVGLVILSFAHDAAGQRNLGYLFTRRAWGQGYASEMLCALQDQLRGTHVVLSGGVMAENAASARVLQKCGFEPGEKIASGEMTYVWDAAQG